MIARLESKALGNILESAVKDVIEAHPGIGAVLERHGIGCTSCKVGICRLKDVVGIHSLPKEEEKRIFSEINDLLEKED